MTTRTPEARVTSKEDETLRPVIIMRPGQIEKVVDNAQQALIANPDCAIYQRGGELIRPIKVGQLPSKKMVIKRDSEATVLVPVREAWLVEQMNKSADWKVVRKVRDELKRFPADPKSIYARTLLSREGEWRFPALRGVINAPTVTLEGRIIERPGYDPESGLLLDVVADTFPAVPRKPTKDDAIKALEFLAYPLRGFPFVDGAARAVALSALLTALIRINLRTSPLHGMDSPTPANGKSLLAETAGMLATGCVPPAMSQGKTEEEDEKRLSTVLHSGDLIIHLDNCGHHLQGDFLCSMLTQEFVQARILGLSERRILPSCALVIASGNNLTFAGDVSRRAVVCRIDSKVERPDERKFDWNPRDDVKADRPRFVIAGLTLLLAYLEAGSPERLRPMGSFEDWELIRGALVWAGQSDPAETRQSVLSGDPQLEEMREIMELWEAAYGTRKVRVPEIESNSEVEAVAALRARFIDIACRGSWSGRSVGRWLMRWKDRIVGGRAFVCLEDPHGHGNFWWLKDAQRGLFPEKG